MKYLAIWASCILVAMSNVVGADSPVLEELYSEKMLSCGISTGTPGFSGLDEKNNYSGLDVDFCRAIAAAIFGDDSRVRYVELDSSQRFDALLSGEVDILSRNTTWTLQRDADFEFEYAGIMFYDGQGFLSNEGKLISRDTDLEGETICVQESTTTESNIQTLKDQLGINFEISHKESKVAAEQAYLDGRCSVFTNDSSALAGFKASIDQGGNKHVTGTLLISKEPLGPLVRDDQPVLADIARWVLNAMIMAEELGIDSGNVDQIAQNPATIEAKKLLDSIDGGSSGACLGLTADWAYNLILQVGNYGEIFNANVGPETALGLERGANALFQDGGLMYALPFGSPCE